jgi:DNA-binding XRE family transcriptional regulator
LVQYPDPRTLLPSWAMDQENNVKKIREAKMLSKAELARLAGISPLTLDRIERGKDCRLATKRKILLALGLTIEQKLTLFKQ